MSSTSSREVVEDAIWEIDMSLPHQLDCVKNRVQTYAKSTCLSKEILCSGSLQASFYTSYLCKGQEIIGYKVLLKLM
jgi:hypothetical protein